MSSATENPAKQKTAIVIGSGFGGSVAASRLQSAGFNVTLLERGPWRQTTPTKHAGIYQAKPLPRNGGMLSVLRSLNLPFGPKKAITLNKNGFLDLYITPKLKVLCTSGVGGGSHVWAAIMERAPKDFWNNRADGLSDAVMEPHYQRVTKELQAIHPRNADQIPNATRHAWKGKKFFSPLQESEHPPMGILYPEEKSVDSQRSTEHSLFRNPIDYHQDNGMFGSPSGSKSTVDALYVIPALKKGLKVRDLSEVIDIASNSGNGYQVRVKHLETAKIEQLDADLLIVAAGTMNTLRLLMASEANGGLDGIPALGHGFGVNGDCMATWQVKDSPARNSLLGTPCHGRVKINGHEDSAYTILVRNELPPVPKFLANKMLKKATSEFTMVAMAQDKADGKITYEDGRLKIDYDAPNDAALKGIYNAFQSLEEQSGWPLKFDKESAVTAHPMGGARIAASASTGVVNSKGEVFGHPGLYICDAACFPQPLGVPPSLSIAAWASHVAAGIVDEHAAPALSNETNYIHEEVL